MTDQTPVETVARASALARRGVTAKVNDTDRRVAAAALASLAQYRDDIARAIHARICEESIEDCLDPVWQGRCARAADAFLTFLTGGAR